MSRIPENTLDQVIRLPSGRWGRGASPNPGGRPKVAGAVRDLARAHTKLAIETLAEICQHGESEAARIAAANALLDRGWGKPTAMVEMHNPGLDIAALIEEAHRHAAEAMAMPRVAELIAPLNFATG